MEMHHLVGLFNFFKAVGYGPILTFISIIVIAPWIAVVWIHYQSNKEMKRLFEMFEKTTEAKEMFNQSFENIVKLTESYKDLSKNMQNLVITNIEVMTQIKEMIKFMLNRKN